MKVSLPGAFLQDLQEGLESYDDPAADIILEKIATTPAVRAGRGYRVIIDVDDYEAEIIVREAEYRAEYWGTSAYGVYQKDHARANAAKRVAASLKASVG